MSVGARSKLYEYFEANGVGNYQGNVLMEVASVSDWPRVIRQLRQDGVIDYDYCNKDKSYSITKINEYKSKTSRSELGERDKYRIRHRDGHRCQSCGKGPADGVRVEVDHKIPVDCGGAHDDGNLWTLCETCNNAKKAFFKDNLDSEVMKLVFEHESGYKKLKTLFENSPNVKYTPSVLQGVSGIRDWTRTIRNIRDKHHINIVWHEKAAHYPNGYYINEV